MKVPNGLQEIKEFYGWSDHYLFDLPSWEALMIVVPPPKGREFYFDKNADGDRDPGEGARGLRVHPRIAEELNVCLHRVSAADLWGFVECVAGGYRFRMQKGSFVKLSMHAFGAAVDFDAIHNGLGVKPELTRMGSKRGLEVVRIFEERGWTWGGRFSRPDAMHMQFGSGF